MPKPILASQAKYLETATNPALNMMSHASPEHMYEESESDQHLHGATPISNNNHHHNHHHHHHHHQMQTTNQQYGQRYHNHHHHHHNHNQHQHHLSPSNTDRESPETQIKSSQSPVPGQAESPKSSQYYNPQTYLDANNNNNRFNNNSGNKSANNNTNNNNNCVNSTSPQPPQQSQQSHTPLNSSNIGGVINNLINSTLIHGNSSAAAAAASTAAAAAATAYLLNNQNGLTPNGAANLILANLNNVNASNLLSAAASAQQHHQQQQQQQQMQNPHQQYADESKCHVCGDKSTGSHFGGISCESCKAFFRRSVQRNRFEDYKCSYSGECKMNTNTRKICQFCRYKSCLAIGMKPKWVLSDDERHQKYGSRRKNKLKMDDPSRQQQSSSLIEQQYNQQSQQQQALNRKDSRVSLERLELDSDRSNKESTHRVKEESTYGSNSDDDDLSSPKESSNTAPPCSNNKSEINRVGVDGMDMRPSSLNLNAYEKDLIDRLSIAFYHSRKFNSIDLNVQKKIAYLFQTQSEGSLKKMSKVILANFIVQPVKRVITFAKLIPDFRKLDINDQMCLLQGGTMEIFICSSSSLYDQISNKFVNVVSKDRNIQGNDTSSVQLDMLRLIWSEDIFEKTIGFLKSMSELRIDEATLILILPLILFSPDRRELRNRYKIYQIQAKYSFLLKKYMIWKYGLNEETIKLYNRLLLKLVELRSLHEMHSSILLDADPTQLEPFPLALILNEKEESTKLKLANATQQQPTATQQPVQQQQQQQQQHLKPVSEETVEVNKAETIENSNYHINSAKPASNGSDHYSNFSILTPASSNYGQISSVSSPTAQTSPAVNFDTNNMPPSNTVEVTYE